MAIPGFTAEAALYPTPTLYRTLGPGVAGSAKGVSANAAILPVKDKRCSWIHSACQFGCYSVFEANSDKYFDCIEDCIHAVLACTASRY
jgi:hypothetical protein